MTRRTNADAGRGSLVPESAEPAGAPQTFADALRAAAVDAERDDMLTAAAGSALAAMAEIGLELHRLAERLDAGTADHAALPADLRELAEWLFAEAEGVNK